MLIYTLTFKLNIHFFTWDYVAKHLDQVDKISLFDITHYTKLCYKKQD